MSGAKACGFVLDVFGGSVKLFDWMSGSVVSINTGLAVFPIQGNFYEISDEGFFLPLPKAKLPPSPFSVYVNHGNSTVVVRTPALTTKSTAVHRSDCEEKEKVMNNYRGAVWSPVLHFIEDPDFFVHNIPEDMPFIVSVVYNTLREEFEVVDKPERMENKVLKNFDLLSPWKEEIQWHETEAGYCPTTGSPRFLNGQLKENKYKSICLFSSETNPFYKENNKRGVPAKCAFLYHNHLGLVRALRDDLEEGKWYKFEFKCGKYKVPKEQRTWADRKKVFEGSQAKEIVNIVPPLRTQLMGPDQNSPFEIRMAFPFQEERDRMGFNKMKSHFYGELVGKVSIHSKWQEEILKRIEDYRKTSKLFAKGIVEGFLVNVSVGRCPHALLQREERDRHCFTVTAVHEITKYNGQSI